jgi:hypothetical protein
MATASIIEYSGLASDRGSGLPLPKEPGLANASSPMTLGATAASAAFADSTTLVRISSVGGTCHVAFGTAPTATAANTSIPSGGSMDFAVPVGATYKVAVFLGA